MSYTFSITPHAMFEDRFEQFVALGVPRAAVEEMRGAITDMWSDTAGGWVFEWSRLARRHLAVDQPYMAAQNSLVSRTRQNGRRSPIK
jgi:esterase FrsA